MLLIFHLIYLGDAQVLSGLLSGSIAPVLAEEIRANIANKDCDLDSMMISCHPRLVHLNQWWPYCLRLKL